MAVPAKASVCAYCKKRLKTGPVAFGCAAVFALVVVLGIIITNAANESAPSTTETSDPASWKAPPAAASAVELARRKTGDPAWLKTRAGKLWTKHHWAPDVCETIAGRKINIGMSKEQVRAAWGKPESVNSTFHPGTVREQWVYGVGNYVYFVDGVMTSMQRSE